MAATDVHQHQLLFNELNKIVKKCRNVSCLNRCGDSTDRCEISMDNILIRELERSNNSLSTIISLLQAQNSKVMCDQNNTPQTRSRQNNPIESLPLSTETRGRSPTSVARKVAVPVPPPPHSPHHKRYRRSLAGAVRWSIAELKLDRPLNRNLSTANSVYEAQSKRIFNSHTNPDEPIQNLDEGWRDVKHKRRRPKPIKDKCLQRVRGYEKVCGFSFITKGFFTQKCFYIFVPNLLENAVSSSKTGSKSSPQSPYAALALRQGLRGVHFGKC
nr:unnamed protein product [Callosobruchus analis]